MKKNEDVRKMAESHWDFIEGLMRLAYMKEVPVEDMLQAMKYLYVEAMIHGYKHSEEDAISGT